MTRFHVTTRHAKRATLPAVCCRCRRQSCQTETETVPLLCRRAGAAENAAAAHGGTRRLGWWVRPHRSAQGNLDGRRVQRQLRDRLRGLRQRGAAASGGSTTGVRSRRPHPRDGVRDGECGRERQRGVTVAKQCGKRGIRPAQRGRRSSTRPQQLLRSCISMLASGTPGALLCRSSGRGLHDVHDVAPRERGADGAGRAQAGRRDGNVYDSRRRGS